MGEGTSVTGQGVWWLVWCMVMADGGHIERAVPWWACGGKLVTRAPLPWGIEGVARGMYAYTHAAYFSDCQATWPEGNALPTFPILSTPFL